MNYKKILILPLALSLSLGSLVACDFGSKDNKPQDTPQGEVDTKPNTDTKPNVEGNTQNGDTNTEQNNNTGGVEQNEGNNEQKPTPSPDTEQGNVVQKKMSLKNIDEFSDSYLKEQVAKDAGVNANQVQIETPEWKTHITTTNDGRKIIEVSLNVKGQDGKVTTYMCVIDLTVISDDLEVVINGPSEIVVGSLEGVTTEKILSKFIITDKKGRNLDATVKLENALDLDLTKAGIYNVLVSAEENTTKIRSLKNITIEVKQQYTVKYQVNGVVVQTDIVEAGKTVVYRGETPTKESTLEFSYEFSGWGQTEGSPIYRDTTFEAKFTETRIAYKVEFLKPDGTLLIEPYYAKVGTNLKDLIVPELPDKRFTGFYLEKELKTPYDTNKVVDNSLTLYGDYIGIVEINVLVNGIDTQAHNFKKTVYLRTKVNDIIALIENEIPEVKYYTLTNKIYENKEVTENTIINDKNLEIILNYEAKEYTLRNISLNNYYSINNTRKMLSNDKLSTKINIKNYKEAINSFVSPYNANNYEIKINNKTVDMIAFEDLINASTSMIIIDICPTEFTLNINNLGVLRANEGLTYNEIFRANGKTLNNLTIENDNQLEYKYLEIEVDFERPIHYNGQTIRTSKTFYAKMYKNETDLSLYTEINEGRADVLSVLNSHHMIEPLVAEVDNASGKVLGNGSLIGCIIRSAAGGNIVGGGIRVIRTGYDTIEQGIHNNIARPVFLTSDTRKFGLATDNFIDNKYFTDVAKKEFANLNIVYDCIKTVRYRSEPNELFTQLPHKDIQLYITSEVDYNVGDFREITRCLTENVAVEGYNGMRRYEIDCCNFDPYDISFPLAKLKNVTRRADNSNLTFDVEFVYQGRHYTSSNNRFSSSVSLQNFIEQYVNYDKTLYEMKFYKDYDYRTPVESEYYYKNGTVYCRLEKIATEVKINFGFRNLLGIFDCDKTIVKKAKLNEEIYDIATKTFNEAYPKNHHLLEISYKGKVINQDSLEKILDLNDIYEITVIIRKIV